MGTERRALVGLLSALFLCTACLTGPGVPPAGGCEPGDLDGDLDVDLADAGLFQAVFTGPRGGSTPAPDNPYLFTGRRLDFDIRNATTGRPRLVLYDYRARAYDPWHGRFGQRDPALYAESLNLYEYVWSNPCRFTDSTGASLLLDLLYSTYLRAGLRVQSAAVSVATLGYFRTIADALSFRSQMLTGIVNAASRMGQRGADFLIRANQIMQGTAGRALNANTYRAAYEWLVYGRSGVLPSGVHVHHVFPQGGPLGQWFASRGIDVNNPLFSTEWQGASHLANSAQYNAAWIRFMNANPNATWNEIVNRARELAQQFGINLLF